MEWLEAVGIPHDHLPRGADRRTGNIKATCPRCHRKNALSIHMTKRVWLCHYAPCGWSGAADKYGARSSMFASKARPIPKPLEETEGEWGAQPMASWRGISTNTLDAYGVTFTVDSHEPIFEYTFRGSVTNTKRRWSSADGKKGFNVEGGSILIPFGYDQAMHRLDELGENETMQLVITEGEVDALSCIEAGWTAISMPNGANKNFDWAENAEPLLRSPKVEIALATDNDTAGIAIESVLANMLGRHRCYRVGYPEGCKDANETLVRDGLDALRACLIGTEPYPVAGIIQPRSIYRDLEGLYHGTNTLLPKETGFPYLDAQWLFVEGQTTLFYGVPGAGKSEFVDSLVVSLCRRHNLKAAVFSPEYYPPERYMVKWVEKYSGKNFFFGDNRIDERELPGYAQWVDNHMSILMPEEFSVDSIIELADVEAYRNQISILVIDNWSAIVQDNDRITETKWIGQELTKLQTWGRNHQCAIFIVNHPTKMQRMPGSSNYYRPKPYDMAGSAQWYNKADGIMMIYRDTDEPRNPIEVEVQKIRYKEIGTEGTVFFSFNRYSSTHTAIGAISRNGDRVGAEPMFYTSQPLPM